MPDVRALGEARRKPVWDMRRSEAGLVFRLTVGARKSWSALRSLQPAPGKAGEAVTYATSLRRTRSGEVLCYPHRTTGIPHCLTVGCARCDAAIEAGDPRTIASTIPQSQRGRERRQAGRTFGEQLKRRKAETRARAKRNAETPL